MRLAVPLAALLLAASAAGCLEASAFQGNGEHLPTALLKQDLYRDLVVEVHHVAGYEPCRSSLDALDAVLRAAADKRTVRVLPPQTIPAGKSSYENRDLVALHRAHLDTGSAAAGVHGHGDTAVLHVLFLNGVAESAAGGHAAGRTLHDHGALFVFRDTFDGVYTLDRHLRRDATCDVERTVLLHELGHAFGLVNRGIPMLHDREADDHAGHSTNPHSVMYPLLRFGPDGLLLQELPSNFDAHDYADVRAFVRS